MHNAQVNAQLTAPFPAHEVEWRMAQTGFKKDGTPWGKCLAYVTNRAIMNRLDEVFGPFGWRNEFKWEQISHGDKTHTVCLCGLSVFLNTELQWVTKWDGAEPTDIETGKGAISDAMKRCAVQWGIGRYLYNLDEGWASFQPDGVHNAKIDGTWHRWSPPTLPPWALPSVKDVKTEGQIAGDSTPAAPQQVSTPQPAPQKAQKPQETPRTPPAATGGKQGTEPQPEWRTYPVPKFIKKYAGGVIGDMQEKDILWWASNYEPKPFKGKINPQDVEFKSMLLAAADAIAGVQPDSAAGEEDVPY